MHQSQCCSYKNISLVNQLLWSNSFGIDKPKFEADSVDSCDFMLKYRYIQVLSNKFSD